MYPSLRTKTTHEKFRRRDPYQHVVDITMGSPVSVVAAGLVVEDFSLVFVPSLNLKISLSCLDC